MDSISPLAKVILAIVLVCAGPAGLYLMAISDDDHDPRPRERADR